MITLNNPELKPISIKTTFKTRCYHIKEFIDFLYTEDDNVLFINDTIEACLFCPKCGIKL